MYKAHWFRILAPYGGKPTGTPFLVPMPWSRIATPALCLASCLVSCKRLWRKLVAQPGTRSRHPASTTASHGTRSPLAADTPLAAHQPLTAHTPLAQRAIEDVLLSSDLLQDILAILVADPPEGGHGMVASVCSQWAASWKALRAANYMAAYGLPLRVRAQRQRRAEQALAVAAPHRHCPQALPTGQFPVTLKFRTLIYDCDEEQEVTLKLASQSAFDRWVCEGGVRPPPSRARWPNSGGRSPRRPRKLLGNHGKATLWVKREADLNSFIPVSQLHVKQLHSLAEAVQAQEDATATGTYLFMEQPRELTSQMSDGIRCHWTEGSSLESLEHRMEWNLGEESEDDAEPIPPGPSHHKWHGHRDLLLCVIYPELRLVSSGGSNHLPASSFM